MAHPTLPNGITTEYAYDAASRLTGLTYKQGATVLGTLTYSYDANGQRRQVGGTWARTGQPDSVNTASHNAANHQLTFGNQTLSYDTSGNLLSDGVNSYTWNARNQLVAINGGVVTASFQYDALGRRTRKTVNGTTTDFLYDGLNPVQEVTGASVTTLLTGLSIDEYFTRTDTAGSQTFLTDGLGSTVALTDQTGGVQAQYTYEAFGTTAGPGGGSEQQGTSAARRGIGQGVAHAGQNPSSPPRPGWRRKARCPSL